MFTFRPIMMGAGCELQNMFILPKLRQVFFNKRQTMWFVLFGQRPNSGSFQHDFIRYITHCSIAGEHMGEQHNLILTKDFLYLL